MKRLLVLRLGSLGDLVHTLPAVAALRAAYPGAQIDWLVEAPWRELLELCPGVSNVIVADTRAWRRALLRPATWRSARATVRGLRQARYEAAIDFQGLYKSAVLGWLSRAPRRLGFAREFAKEGGAARFYTEAVRPPEGAHVIRMNLALAQAAGATGAEVRFPLRARPQDEAAVEELLAREHLRDFFLLSPGGGWGAKRWPPERYAQVHNELARRRGWRSVLNVGPGEEPLIEQFMAEARVVRPVVLTLPLGQLAALVRRARLLIGGDTGPLHLAAALETPVVGLYGPTDPARNGPWGERAAVVHHREASGASYKHENRPSPAMLAITVEEVLAAAVRCLEKAGG